MDTNTFFFNQLSCPAVLINMNTKSGKKNSTLEQMTQDNNLITDILDISENFWESGENNFEFSLQSVTKVMNFILVMQRMNLPECKKTVLCLMIEKTHLSGKLNTQEPHHSSTIILKNILDNLPVFVYWKNKDSIFLGCNNLFAEFAGYSSYKKMIGKSDFDVTSKEKAMEIISHDKMIMNKKKKVILEEVAYDNAGNMVAGLSFKAPFYDALGEVAGIVGITLDTSDIAKLKETQLKLEETLEKSKVAEKIKDSILANFRHDWITPMAGLDLLKSVADAETDPDTKETLEMIHDSNHALFSHLKAVKELVEALEGRLPITTEIINCYEILHELYTMYRSAAALNKIELVIEANEVDWQQAQRGDKERIMRILITLISNAVKFTHEGGTVSLMLSKKETDDGSIVANFLVKDTGIGISEEHIKEIYTSFYKIKPSYNSSDLIESGAGVGLAIAKRYADDMKAQLSCESVEGKGSVFALSVTLDRSLISRDELKSFLKA